MAHVEDRWLRNGGPSDRWGHGLRYRVRWHDQHNRERSRSFRSREDASALSVSLEDQRCKLLAEGGSNLCEGHGRLEGHWGISGMAYLSIPDGLCAFGVRISESAGSASNVLCGSPADDSIPGFALCHEHRSALDGHVAERVAAELDRLRCEREEKAAREEDELCALMDGWTAAAPSVVYYLRRVDGLIKIGTTTHLRNRMSAIARKHGPLQLLATHGGCFEREGAQHDQFEALHVGNEWFKPGPDLVGAIVEIRRRPENMSTAVPGTVPVDFVESLLGTVAA